MASRKGKAQFYVFYLGWKECRGIRGQEFVEPIVRELIDRRYNEELPKLTIEATRKELKIMQLIEKKKGKVEKLKYPPIPTKDVTFATQARSPDEDVVACIYLGYNPQTRAAVHVHVYRCDSPATASMFVDHLLSFIDLPEHRERTAKIEGELVAKGQVFAGPSPYGMPDPAGSPRYDSQDDIYNRRPYGSRDNLRDGYQDQRDPRDAYQQQRDPRDAYQQQRDPRDVYQNQRDPRDERDQRDPRDVRDQRDPRDYREVREDPYSLREFRRELQDTRPSPREDFRNHDPPRGDTRNGGAAGRGGGYAAQPDHRDHHREPVDHYHEQEDVYQSVTAELKAKLAGRNGPAGPSTGPLLLPAKDYDTVRRKGGNLDGIEERRSRNKNIIGGGAANDDDHSSNGDRGSGKYSGYDDPYDSPADPYSRWRDTPDTRDYNRGGRPHSPEPRGHPARAASPEPRGPPRGERRGRSPVRNQQAYMDSRLARAISPPPGHELRNTYFPNDDMLPNYLAAPGGGGGYGGYPRAVSPARRSPRPASPPRSRYGGSDEGGRRQPNKYTASNLGLKPGAPQPQPRAPGYGRPRSDEGYLSMDRENPYRGAPNKDPYDDHRGGGGYQRNLNDSPPPREVIAGDQPHPELAVDDFDLPGSKQSFLY